MNRFIYTVLSFLPAFALAQPRTANLDNLGNFVTQIGGVVARIIPVMFALAIVYFFWGVIKYIRSAGDPKEADAGKSIMIYGVIGIAVMASIYGLIAWLQGTLGVGSGGTVILPIVPGLPIIP